MIRRYDERLHEQKKMFGGEGEALFHRILNGPDEMYGKGRLKGRGEYNDNGTIVEVAAGDVTFTDDGEGHALKCVSDEPLEAIALILYK